MKPKIIIICLLLSAKVFSQDTTVVNVSDNDLNGNEDVQPLKIFYDQRTINSNTVEVLRKGVMQFRIIHNFGDVAGKYGGIKRFFGLDHATDIKISFQLGLSDKLNILVARTRGDEGAAGDNSLVIGPVQQLWELGLKYSFMKQMPNDPKHPLSLTLYANNVISSMDSATFGVYKERGFKTFSDRMSQLVQLMIAKRFGNFSLQASPIYLHTNYSFPGDDLSLFALEGAVRIPISKKFFVIADYTHPFHSEDAINIMKSHDIHLHDAFGVGIEVVTAGHVFHMNFTNSTSVLENRLIPKTYTGWGEGKYRWGFNISRNFVLFKDKKSS